MSDEQWRRVRAGETFQSDGQETVVVVDEVDGQDVTLGAVLVNDPGVYRTAGRTYGVGAEAVSEDFTEQADDALWGQRREEYAQRVRDWLYDNHPAELLGYRPPPEGYVHWAPTTTPEPLSAEGAAKVKAQMIPLLRQDDPDYLEYLAWLKAGRPRRQAGGAVDFGPDGLPVL